MAQQLHVGFVRVKRKLTILFLKIMKHKRPTIKIHKYVGRVGAGAFALVAFSGFYQAVIVNESEPEIWFIVLIASILLLLAGVITFLIVKGIKKPVPRTPEPSPGPVKNVETPEPAENADNEE